MLEGILIVLLSFGVTCISYFIKSFKKVRLLAKANQSINKYNGYYKIKGKVVATESPFIAPFSNKACVYYHFIVDKDENSKNKFINDEQFQPFGIDDGKSVKIIDIRQAKLNLKLDKVSYSELLFPANEHKKQVLKRYGKKDKWLVFDRTLKYKETYLEEGDELLVIGKMDNTKISQPGANMYNQIIYVTDKEEKKLFTYYRFRVIIWLLAIVFDAIAVYLIYTYGNQLGKIFQYPFFNQ